MEIQEDNGNKEQFMTPMGVTNDTIAQVTKEEMHKNLTKDVEAYQKALETAQREHANYKAQVDIDLEMYEIMSQPNAIRKIVPEREYEKSDRFWELATEKHKFKVREDKTIIEGQLKMMADKIQNIEGALQRAKDKLERFGAD